MNKFILKGIGIEILLIIVYLFNKTLSNGLLNNVLNIVNVKILYK